VTTNLLIVDGLTITSRRATLVDGLSFGLAPGSRTGLIGESGSGKTLTALAIMGLLPDNLRSSGTIRLGGRMVSPAPEHELVALRGNAMTMVFQEPMTALNPVMRVGRQVAEPLGIHEGVGRAEAFERAVELLERVGIEHAGHRARSFPHELSGGQRQRAMIAMALACGPELVIADEPTTALDVTVQAQVLGVLRERVAATGAALLLITHDLPVVAGITERVMVLREGELVEEGSTSEVFDRPSHPHTAALVAAVPPLSRGSGAIPRRRRTTGGQVMISAHDVVKSFRLRRRSVQTAPPVIRAVDGVSIDVRAGETFGIVGESGSGKTTLARLLVGLDRPDSGSITVDGIDVTASRRPAPLHRVAQMVFQDPMGSLDPRMTVDDIIAEPLRSLRVPGDHTQRVAELLEAVALPADSVHRYPHQFSGGQRQRIAIARALAPRPVVLVADEPVSALDMSVQTITLDLLAHLKEQFELTMVFISHDLSVVHEICDRVAVLEHGRVVEHGTVDDVFHNPADPYTRRLLSAIPRLDR